MRLGGSIGEVCDFFRSTTIVKNVGPGTFMVGFSPPSRCEVARLLNKAPGSVSRWITDGHELQLSNGAFRADLASLRREVESLPVSEIPLRRH